MARIIEIEFNLHCLTNHALISALHWCSRLQLLRPQNMLEHVVLSSLIPSVFSWSLDIDCERGGDSSWGLLTLESKLGHGPSLHVHRGIVTEGNGLQVMGQNISDEMESTRLFLASGEPSCSDISLSLGWSTHGVHKLSDTGNFISFAEEPGSLVKDIIPCRQRGQGMEPGGIDDSEGMLLVEQRYRAHLTQSSWEHPESW